MARKRFQLVEADVDEVANPIERAVEWHGALALGLLMNDRLDRACLELGTKLEDHGSSSLLDLRGR
ncbi:MAG: hypothetical protein SFX73_37835 [Kofleriaceae bacterium]|nr:hypothetical protein [Kofleriaceae bacterium]